MPAPNTQTDTSQGGAEPLVDLQNDETSLTNSITRLETFLLLMGFLQNSFFSITLSWAVFLLVGLALPLGMIKLSSCTGCEKFEVNSFELEILVFQLLVAGFSLLCVSSKLRKYGVRRLLFVEEKFHGHTAQYCDDYARKIHEFFRLLVAWVLPCLLLKTVREMIRMLYGQHDSWWQAVAILVALIVSWTYSTLLYISGCALFNLVCNLLVIHFENYGKLLERDLDVSVYIEEHMRMIHDLSRISHRFRVFFILELLFVTASQFVALVQTTGNQGIINLINGGDFAVSSIVELVGVVICLHAAAKITHRAQGVASFATRWHSIVTCTSGESSQGSITNNIGKFDPSSSTGLLPISYSESDLETGDYIPVPTTTQLASHMTSYHKRQAFVTYLLSNPGGFTIFGWTIDRMLINTIFFLEMSLVLFVLGKTITFSSTWSHQHAGGRS